jgi:acetyl esterase/lipase
MVRASDEALPMPAGLVLPTPAVDLTESGDTFRTLDGVDGGLIAEWRSTCVREGLRPPRSPLSPLFADLSGIPPRVTPVRHTVQMQRTLRRRQLQPHDVGDLGDQLRVGELERLAF